MYLAGHPANSTITCVLTLEGRQVVVTRGRKRRVLGLLELLDPRRFAYNCQPGLSVILCTSARADVTMALRARARARKRTYTIAATLGFHMYNTVMYCIYTHVIA
jgi:hypothetical protein